MTLFHRMLSCLVPPRGQVLLDKYRFAADLALLATEGDRGRGVKGAEQGSASTTPGEDGRMRQLSSTLVSSVVRSALRRESAVVAGVGLSLLHWALDDSTS